MYYLSGAAFSHVLKANHPRIGLLGTPQQWYKSDWFSSVVWGADTGCFSSPAKYSDSGYLSWLKDRQEHRNHCLFATAPDVLGDPESTWARAVPMLGEIRGLGFQAALVGQDGVECMSLDWTLFDVLFLGGSTEWKLGEGGRRLTEEALSRGKRVHMGRVNSKKRLLLAQEWGCSSVDGTFLAFGPDKNLPRLLSWMEVVRQRERQTKLDF